jgi:hypothetical protein
MNKIIYQEKQLKLHQRATLLLKLLKEAQRRQTIFDGDLALWRQGLDTTRTMISEEDILIKIARMNQIQRRILKSYHFIILDLYEITEQFMLPINLMHF